MVSKIFLYLAVLILSISSYAQIGPAYTEWVERAKEFYDAKQYLRSAKAYSHAFETIGWKGLPDDRYMAACSWALAGYTDSAFFNLERIATAFRVYYSDYDKVVSEPAFSALHSDKRWQSLLEIIKANQQKEEINLNISLTEQLNAIYSDDQKYRKMGDSVKMQFGEKSDELQVVYHIIGEKDFFNVIKVKKILDTYGWLGADSVGVLGNKALFLVIQHADNGTQEKYFPMVKEAVKNGKVNKEDFAALQDRMNLSNGKKQIYGSQIRRDVKTNFYYVRPLEDPDNVDKRRADVGLQPLADYVKMWKIAWDVEQYKKNLPDIELKEK